MTVTDLCYNIFRETRMEVLGFSDAKKTLDKIINILVF